MEIIKKLFDHKDDKYAAFQRKLIPNIDPQSIIGVRTPILRDIAKTLAKDGRQNEIYDHLPHTYFEENQLHAFLISSETDYKHCIRLLDVFLPFVDNWATCDQMSPKIFKGSKGELLKEIDRWLESEKTYTLRFGIGMLMSHFLDEDFRPDYLEMVASLRSDEYYVNMMIAWFFATALAKQYNGTLKYIKNCRLKPWTHNKTIQKAAESMRISEERKNYLRSLKICPDR